MGQLPWSALTVVVRSEEPLSALRDDFQRSLSVPPEDHVPQTENPNREKHYPQTDRPDFEDRSRPVDPNAIPVKQDEPNPKAAPVQKDEPKQQPRTDLLDEDATLVENENDDDDDEDMENDIKGVYYQGEDGELTPVVW